MEPVCTDVKLSMIGSIKDFVTLIKERNHDVITTHFFLHRKILVSKTTGEDLKQVLDVALSMVSFMNRTLLNHAYLQSRVKVCKKTT
jgi:hypothetical protein